VVAEADQIVNIDITTEDLRRRLEEGKVYTTERVETALSHFFAASNLEQLRELTLRELAAQIDSRRRAPQADVGPSSPDQVMVCLSSRSPNSEALLRYASRLAGRLNRNWYAVYVQTAVESPTKIDAETQRVLSNALTLAQQLGATVFTYKGEDVVKTILQFAREYRVGHIVVGRSGRKLPLWKRLSSQATLVQRLVEEAKGTTVVVIDTREVGAAAVARAGNSVMDTDKLICPPLAHRLPKQFPTGITVLFWTAPMEKEAAMRELLAACCREDKGVPEAAAWEALVEREGQGSTFLGEEVALPHARLSSLRDAAIGIGVAVQGVREPSTGNSIRIMFLLLSPMEPPEVHVRLLSRISKLARNDLLRQELLNSASTEDAARILEEHLAVADTQTLSPSGAAGGLKR
jgi:two-component system sensor histidine kinase KdpD